MAERWWISLQTDDNDLSEREKTQWIILCI